MWLGLLSVVQVCVNVHKGMVPILAHARIFPNKEMPFSEFIWSLLMRSCTPTASASPSLRYLFANRARTHAQYILLNLIYVLPVENLPKLKRTMTIHELGMVLATSFLPGEEVLVLGM